MNRPMAAFLIIVFAMACGLLIGRASEQRQAEADYFKRIQTGAQ